jgi:hypothetical protein
VSRMDLTLEKERLNQQFAGGSARGGDKCLEDAATSISKGARILMYIRSRRARRTRSPRSFDPITCHWTAEACRPGCRAGLASTPHQVAR